MKSKAYLQELSQKDSAALLKDLEEAKKELFNLRFQNATNQLDNTARITQVRKNVARLQTVITQKTQNNRIKEKKSGKKFKKNTHR